MAAKCDDKLSKAVQSSDDETACDTDSGFSFFVISAPATAAQTTKICASTACQKTIALMKSVQPTECNIWRDFMLYADILNPLDKTCTGKAVTAAPGATTPKPSNDSSTPVTAAPLSPTTAPTTVTPSPTPTTFPPVTATATTAPPSAHKSTTTNAASDSSNTAAIGGIVGGFVVFALIVFFVFRSRRRRTSYDNGNYNYPTQQHIERAPPAPGYNDMETPSRYNASSQGTGGSISQYQKTSSNTLSSTQASSRAPSSQGQSTRSVNPSGNSLWNDLDIDRARIELDDVRINEAAAPLGRGGFCEVLVGRYEGQEVAVKRLLPGLRDDDEMQNMLLAEAKTMTSLNHRHIVKLHGIAWNEPRDLCIVTELVRGTDMGKYIAHAKANHAAQGFTTEKVLMALQIADALDYLHRQNPPVLHRDLKPGNILVTGDNQAKLADFGIARENDATVKTTQVGTKFWMAPEQALSKKYDEKVDIFAFGVLLSELDTYESPYAQSLDGRSMADAVFFENVRNGRLAVVFSGDETDPMAQLGRECVRVYPRDRPSASELFRRLQEILHEFQKRDDLKRALETMY